MPLVAIKLTKKGVNNKAPKANKMEWIKADKNVGNDIELAPATETNKQKRN